MYEEKYYPIERPDPVEAIKFRMEQMGLAQKDMIKYFGSKSKASEVLNGKRSLTLSMMRALNEGLGIPAEILLKEPGRDFPVQIQDMEWSRFPIIEMAKRGWVSMVDDINEKAEELLRDFFEQAGGLEAVARPCLRQGKKGRYNPKTDLFALTAWCTRVQYLAFNNPLKAKYKPGTVKLSTLQEVARLSYFENGPLLAKEYLEKHGIHLVIVPHLPKTYLDGAAIMLPDGTPVIGLTLRHDRVDNFWFCLLHELAHVSRHLSLSDGLIVDDLDSAGKKNDTQNKIENEADEMTANGLIPKLFWDKKTVSEKVTTEEVCDMAAKLKIHPAIIAGRIRFERDNYRLLSNLTGNKQVRKHFVNSFQENT